MLGPSVTWDGLLWMRDWVAECEGPYTRLAKLVLANAEGEEFASQLVMGVKACTSAQTGEFHQRTLLSAHWMNRGSRAAHGIAPAIRSSTLDKIVGPWWKWLATDKRLRFCPICLGAGFHSCLTQILALARCPTHREPLLDVCVGCGAAAPRFALDKSFDGVLTCIECGRPLAGSSIGDLPGSWKALDECMPAHSALQQALTPIQGERLLAWEGVGVWKPSNLSDPVAHKQAVFHVLKSVLKLSVPEDLLAPSPSFRLHELNLLQGAPCRARRVAMVKAIRRHLLSKLPTARTGRARLADRIVLDWQSRQVIAFAGVSDAHAVLTWLLRFGAWPFDRLLRVDPYARMQVPPELLNWPKMMRISDESWGVFAWECLTADRMATMEWDRRLRADPDPETAAAWKHLSNSMRSQLSARCHIPPGVSVIVAPGAGASPIAAWLVTGVPER